MELLLRIKGPSPEEMSRGLAAAEGVLNRAGITARQAAAGVFAIEGWDIRGFPEDDAPSDVAHWAAQIWSDAEDAAVEACCAGWTDDKKPVTSVMELLEDPETQLADRKTALAKLRLLADAADGNGEFVESDVGTLACRVAAGLDDNSGVARDLVGDVTIAFTTLILSRFHPEEPIEPKRKAVHDAIDALEKATDESTSH